MVGKFKDEAGSIPIEAFVALKAKTYIFRFGDTTKVTAKGVPKRARNEQTVEDFEGYTRNPGPPFKFQKLGPSNYEVYTWAMSKLGFHNFDDKGYYVGNKKYAHGDYRVKRQKTSA